MNKLTTILIGLGFVLFQSTVEAQTPLRQSTNGQVVLVQLISQTDGVTPMEQMNESDFDVITVYKAGDLTPYDITADLATQSDTNGMFQVTLSSSRTDTLGQLTIVMISGHSLPIHKECIVLPAQVYDSLYAGSDKLQVDTVEVEGTDATTYVESRTLATASYATASAVSALPSANDIRDSVWANSTRTLTAGTNIVLAKGTGITGFNDLDAAGIRTAVGLSTANLGSSLTTLQSDVTDIYGYVYDNFNMLDLVSTQVNDMYEGGVRVHTIEEDVITNTSIAAGAIVYGTELTGITTSNRVIDVSSGGAVGIDWANVESPSTTVNLSGTTVGAVTVVNGLANNTITTASINDTAFTAAKFHTNVITGIQNGLATSSALATVDGVVDAIKVKTDFLPSATAGTNGGLPTVNGSNYIAGIAGTLNTLDALDTAQDSQHTATQNSIDTIDGNIDDIKLVTEKLDTGLEEDGDNYRWTADALAESPSGGGLDAAGIRSAIGLATANLDTQLGDIPTVSEFNARSLASADYATSTALTSVGNAVTTIDGIVDSILEDTGTTLPSTLSGIVSDIEGVVTLIEEDVIPPIEDLYSLTDSNLTILQTTLQPYASVHSQASQGATDSSITLHSSASATNGYYVGMRIVMSSGGGAGQSRVITAYNGSSKVATVSPNWVTNPTTGGYYIVPQASTYLTPESVATVSADVWSESTRTLTAGTNIVLAKGTGITGFNDLSQANIRTAVGLASANLDTQLSTIDGVVDDILVDTGTTLPSTLSGLATQTSVNTIDGIIDNIFTAFEQDGGVYRLTSNALSQGGAVSLEPEDIDAIAQATAEAVGEDIGELVWGVETRTLTSGDNIVLAKGTGVTGFNDITANAARDAVWANATRTLTSGTNIVLAKGTGLTGFNDLDAAGIRTAVGLATANLDSQLETMYGDVDNINNTLDELHSWATVWFLNGIKIEAGAITAATIDSDAFTAAKFAADVTTEFQTGLATATSLSNLQSDVTGLISSVGELPTNAELASALEGITFDDTDILSAIDALPTNGELATALSPLAASTEITSVLNVLGTPVGASLSADIAGIEATVEAEDIRDAIGLAAANLDSQLASIKTDTGTTLPNIIGSLDVGISSPAIAEPVPPKRTAIVESVAGRGIIKEGAPFEMTAGTDVNLMYAVEFARDLQVNGVGNLANIVNISVVPEPATALVEAGQEGGITVNSEEGIGVWGSLAKFRATAIHPGRYTVLVEVTYAGTPGTTRVARIPFIVRPLPGE